MYSEWWRRLALGLSVVTAGTFAGAGARADEEPKGVRDFLIKIGDGELRADRVDLSINRYLIGVKSIPADAALHAQLPELPKEQGLLVQEVVADHAAAKAGIQPHDILIAAFDKPLSQVADLSAAIESSKGAELTIKLIRGGKTISIAVKPDEQKPLGEPVRVPLGHDRETLEKWMKQISPETNQQPLRLEVLRDWIGKHELPDDVSINIYREGKQPAKITVKKGDQKWDVNEDNLGKLPEDIRHHVEQFVGAGPMRVELKDFTAPVPLTVPLGDVLTRNPADLESRVEKRLVEMTKRLDEMRSAIEQLRSQCEGTAEKKSR